MTALHIGAFVGGIALAVFLTCCCREIAAVLTHDPYDGMGGPEL